MSSSSESESKAPDSSPGQILLLHRSDFLPKSIIDEVMEPLMNENQGFPLLISPSAFKMATTVKSTTEEGKEKKNIIHMSGGHEKLLFLLTSSLAKFSMDLVRLVGQYAKEYRFVQLFPLPINGNPKIQVNPKTGFLYITDYCAREEVNTPYPGIGVYNITQTEGRDQLSLLACLPIRDGGRLPLSFIIDNKRQEIIAASRKNPLVQSFNISTGTISEPKLVIGMSTLMCIDNTNGRDLLFTAVADYRSLRVLDRDRKAGGKMWTFRFADVGPCGGIVAHSGNLFVSTQNDVAVYDYQGTLLYRFGRKGGYVVDGKSFSRLEPIVIPDPKQKETERVMQDLIDSSKAGILNWPGDLAINSDGHLLVADRCNKRVQIFTLQGNRGIGACCLAYFYY